MKILTTIALCCLLYSAKGQKKDVVPPPCLKFIPDGSDNVLRLDISGHLLNGDLRFTLDTVPALIEYCDTGMAMHTNSYILLPSRKLMGDTSYTYPLPKVLWMFGYIVRKRIPLAKSLDVGIDAQLLTDDHILAGYLDEHKKPLKSTIYVWMAEERRGGL